MHSLQWSFLIKKPCECAKMIQIKLQIKLKVIESIKLFGLSDMLQLSIFIIVLKTFYI